MRVARITVPGLVHHIISRLLDRRWLIGNDSEARRRYLAWVSRAFERSDWRWLGYGVMSNHLHLVAIAGRTPPEHWLKRAHSPFGQWLNERHDGLGHVFAQRPTITVVGEAKVARVLAYVHNNPVRANVVMRAADATSEWTSHRAYVGLDQPPPGLDVAEGLRRCGYEGDVGGRRAFDGWVDERAADQEERLEMERIRRESRRFGQVELGTPIAEERITVPIVARPYARLRIGIDPQRLVAVVAHTLGVSQNEITGHAQKSARFRRIAVLAGQAHGLSITAVSLALGISVQAGSKLVSRPDRVAAVLAELTRVHDAIRKSGLIELSPSPGKSLERRGRRRKTG